MIMVVTLLKHIKSTSSKFMAFFNHWQKHLSKITYMCIFVGHQILPYLSTAETLILRLHVYTLK